MIDGIDHGIIDWNHDEGKQWLTRAKELQKQLFALIHMTYSQPSRSEELAQLRVDNSYNGMSETWGLHKLFFFSCPFVRPFWRRRVDH